MWKKIVVGALIVVVIAQSASGHRAARADRLWRKYCGANHGGQVLEGGRGQG
jgi:hypothetical protein